MTFSMPLLAREQAETQQDDLALDAKQVLVKTRVDERHVGDAVRDQIDLLRPARDRSRCRNSAPRSLITTNRSDSAATSSSTRR